MENIKTICVYCGASQSTEEVYKQAARDLGKVLADNEIRLVYGGGRLGLMGLVADGVLENGGNAIGFTTEYLNEFEGGHVGLDELHVVDTMHTRKMKMSEHADAFAILPGGFGTLDELFEIITWKQLKIHDKPIILININNYWDPLIALAKHIIEVKFARPEHANIFKVINSAPDLISALKGEPEPKIGFSGEWV